MTDNDLLPRDRDAVAAFRNFLSWGERPTTRFVAASSPPHRDRLEMCVVPLPARAVPPAWWAYAFGVTQFCPPAGTL